MNNPQSIETAPTDGTVILSDCGFVKWKERQDEFVGWCLVYVDKFEFGDAIYGESCDMLRVYPSLWVPVPQWIMEGKTWTTNCKP